MIQQTGFFLDMLLFRGIVHTKSGEQLRKKGGISYTRARELVLQKLAALGLDPKRFGLHSLRSGGVSAAANASVPTGWLNATAGGTARMPKTDMSRTLWRADCQSLETLDSRCL